MEGLLKYRAQSSGNFLVRLCCVGECVFLNLQVLLADANGQEHTGNDQISDILQLLDGGNTVSLCMIKCNCILIKGSHETEVR